MRRPGLKTRGLPVSSSERLLVTHHELKPSLAEGTRSSTSLREKRNATRLGMALLFLLELATVDTRKKRGGKAVSEIKISEHESFEAALKRFNRKIQQDGILAEARRRRHYEPPSLKRKRKAAARKRRARKG